MTAVASARPLGVLLLTFGSATTASGVREYMASVRGERGASDDIVHEFERRYALVGRSPLIDITLAQASALQGLLDERHGQDSFAVAAGMLHSEPRVGTALERLLHQRVTRVIAVVLAPQYSPLILAGYERALADARDTHPDLTIDSAGAWSDLPEWVDSLAERVDEALGRLSPSERERIPVIFTAHSVPLAVMQRDPGYIEQLRATASAVAARARLGDEWRFAYQSAGHTPEEWLKPDVKDLLPGLREAGADSVLVVPLQFLADHLEILYDIDIAAADEAAALGISLHRIALPNTSPTFIAALAAVVERESMP